MIDRRRFIGTSIAGGAAAALGTAACAPDSPGRESEPGGAGAAGTQPGAFELDEATVADLQAAMESGEWTARSITELYLERIAALDG